MMDICRSLLDNSKLFVISVRSSANCLFSFLDWFWEGSWMSDFLMKYGNFVYYIMKLGTLLKSFVLAELWYCLGRGSGDHLCYCWVWVSIQAHLALADTLAGEGRGVLLLLPRGLHWYLGSKGYWKIDELIGKSLNFQQASSDTTPVKAGVLSLSFTDIVRCVGDGLLPPGGDESWLPG